MKLQVGQTLWIKAKNEKAWELGTVTSIGQFGFFRYRPSWATSMTKTFNPKKHQFEFAQ